MDNHLLAKALTFDQKLLKIQLKESHEDLVSLEEHINKFKVKIILNKKPIILDKEQKIFYLRKSVCLSLMNATKELNKKGYILQMQDAYRSLSNQKAKFFVRVKELKKQYPKLKANYLLKAANIYTAGVPILAAHTAGAAVDIILLDSNYKKINMGSEYPSGTSESVTNFKKLPKKIVSLRKMFCKIMELNGLINYPFEWWHFSQGDVCATYLTKNKFAIYGPVEFNPVIKSSKYLPIKKSYSYFS